MANRTPAQRRRWQATLIVSLFFAAVAAAAGTGWWYAREAPPHQGPIVLIALDALPASSAALSGAGALASLVADSVQFAHAYTHSTQLLPAQASLLTGTLPFEHGIRDDGGYTLRDASRTLAEQLRNRGFATGGAVSSFLLHREAGVDQGFGFFDAEMPETAAGEAPAVRRDGLRTFDVAEQWMRGQDGQRYFLFLEIGHADADSVVARLVAFLKARKLYDQATIVLTATRGANDADTRLDERTLAVPLVVKQPDGEGAGRRVSIPVQLIDVVPTMLDLVRAPIPGGLRGRSLRPLLDAADGVIVPRPIYSESLEAAWRFGGSPVQAVTLDGYRLTRGATEALAWVGDTPAPADPDEGRATQLRTALDRLVANQKIQPPSDIPQAEAASYAAAGYLPGLRTIEPLAVALDPREESAVGSAHRAAVAMVAAGQDVAAIAALRAIVGSHPDLAPVQFQIASLLSRSGRIPEAVTAFSAVAALRPDDSRVATLLAETYLRARQVDEAVARANEAVALAMKPDDAPRELAAAHEVAARAALEAGDHEGATAHAEEAHDADPSLPLPAYVQGRLAYEAGLYEEALVAFQEAEATLAESGRELSELHLYAGDSLAQLDRFAEAETEFKEELRLFPANINAYASLAMLYRASNRVDASAQTIDDLLVAAPTPEGYALAARLWTIVGQRARADAVRADARRRFRGLPTIASINR